MFLYFDIVLTHTKNYAKAGIKSINLVHKTMSLSIITLYKALLFEILL